MIRTRISISLRITFAIIISFLLILSAISILVVKSIDLFFMRDAERQLTDTMNLILNNRGELATDMKDTLNELPLDRSMEISVFLPNGTRLYERNSFFSLPLEQKVGFDEVRVARPQPTSADSDLLDIDSDTVEFHALVLRSDTIDVTVPVIFQISRNLDGEDHFLSVLKRFLILADLLGVLISFVVGFSISRRVLRPVDNITRTAGTISASDLSARIPESGPDDELARLARSFNTMLDRLQDSFEKQKRFVSDASHELRTPLSIISGYAGMLGRWAKSDPALLDESIEAIKAETSRMRTLIERLLFLARSDSSVLQMKKERIRLKELLEGVVQDIAYAAPDRELRLEMEQDAAVSGDPDMLRQMFFIFLDNSIRYADSEKPIEISVSSESGLVRVSVRDYGQGIEPGMQEKIFDRFYRTDDSRSKSSGGSGLGLSIAREIIEQHGGTVSVSSVPGRGTVFTISLPLF